METGVELWFQQIVDGAVAVHAGLACEGGGHDADAHMGLGIAAHAGLMAGVVGAFIDHFKPLGLKCLLQAVFDAVADAHGVHDTYMKRALHKPPTNTFVNSCFGSSPGR